MPKFTQVEKRYLQSLVRKCSLYRLTEREALDYIKSKLGRSIGPSHYYTLKRKLESDSNAQDWLTNFAKTQFVSEHMKRYGEMDLLLQVGLHMLIEQRAKPPDEQDSSLILAIMHQITKIGERLTSLQGGAPVLSQLSAMLQGRNQQQIQQQLLPPSSRITTTATNGSNGSTTDEEQQDVLEIERLTAHIPNLERRMEVQRALLEDRRQERERSHIWDAEQEEEDS